MSAVRIRSSAPDPFHDLRGHAYIQARGLDPRVVRQQHTNSDACQCGPCNQARMLPAVQNICKARDRRQASPLHVVRWSDPSDEEAQALLDHHTASGG